MNLNLTSLLASDPVNTNLIITAERNAASLPSPLRKSSYQKILEFQSKRIVMNLYLTNLHLIQYHRHNFLLTLLIAAERSGKKCRMTN